MPSLWRGSTCGWRRKVFHCLQLTQIFRNPRSLGTMQLQIPSLVTLEMRKVQAMEIAGNRTAETPTAFLQQLRENHPGPLVMIWDNGPAHRREAIRSHPATPDLHLRLVALPAYSPDFNADEAVWDWAREEVTANECLGTKAQVQEKMYVFFGGLAHRKDEVKHRCRTLLQARADALMMKTATPFAIAAKCSSHLGFCLVRASRP